MEFHHADRKLFIGTYGVSAYKANIPLNFSNIHDLQTNNKIGIFPNPARINEAINLTFNSDFISDVIVKIYDISGKEISKSVFKSRKGSNNFNICNNIKLKKGTYLCKLSINEKNQSIKFIVNN